MNTQVPTAEYRNVEITFKQGPFWNRSETRAVRGVDLNIAPGETVGLVGESGSGKSTLGRVSLGLIKPTNGEFLFEGKSFNKALRREGALSLVLQHPEWSLNPRLKNGVSVAEPLIIQGKYDKKTCMEKVNEILGQVGLNPKLASRYPNELSGGQCQRVAIARALITTPRFIVFDEAVSALDVSVQSQILNLIRKLQEKHGFSAIFISHDLAATRFVSHRIAVMRKGRFVEVNCARKFYDRPDHEYSRQLYDSIG